jgi:hypothetical protein
MSISIATMGKFWPATGSGEKIVYIEGHGTAYGDTNLYKKKIIINVEKVHYDKYNKKDIKILAVKEE